MTRVLQFMISLIRFLGKAISAFISELVQEGEVREHSLDSAFDYERWKKAVSKKPVRDVWREEQRGSTT